jgi:hypothetical protein
VPEQYIKIRDSYLKRGASEKRAKEIAARTYISRGKTKSARSTRARSLHTGR